MTSDCWKSHLRAPGNHGFEYIRHGTTSLIGFFDAASEVVYPPYLNETRNKTDFCEAVRQIIETDPEKEWISVCYGPNTHKSESFVNLVAQACHMEDDLEKKGKTGIQKSLESRAVFFHDPDHRIRFVYTPKHSSWMNQLEI